METSRYTIPMETPRRFYPVGYYAASFFHHSTAQIKALLWMLAPVGCLPFVLLMGLATFAPAFYADWLASDSTQSLLTLATYVFSGSLLLAIWGLVPLWRTWQDMQLLQFGVCAEATITRVHEKTAWVNRYHELELRYTDLAGVPRFLRENARARHSVVQLERVPQEGERVPILIHPRGLPRALAPGLRRVEFEDIQDQRPAQIEPQALDEPRLQRELSQEQRGDLLSAPAQQHSLWQRLLGARQPIQLGAVNWDEHSLRLHMEPVGQEAPQGLELLWAEPFVVQLSVWPVSSRLAELNLALRRRGAPADAPWLRCKTLVPQSSLSASLPVQQVNAPYLPQARFEKLWPAICFHAALHGQPLSREVAVQQAQEVQA